jgi:hypothetical protein
MRLYTMLYAACTALVGCLPMGAQTYRQRTELPGGNYRKCDLTIEDKKPTFSETCRYFLNNGRLLTESVSTYDARTRERLSSLITHSSSKRRVMFITTPKGLVKSVDEDGDGHAESSIRFNRDGSIDNILGSDKDKRPAMIRNPADLAASEPKNPNF